LRLIPTSTVSNSSLISVIQIQENYQAAADFQLSPNQFPVEWTQPPTPAIKLESNVIGDASSKGDCQQANKSAIGFSTHVDTLMKAIQAKQQPNAQQLQLPARSSKTLHI
jgi:hypothetical protein